jgi:hypothetical protein
VYGFDLDYRGNHDQVLAEALWSDHPLSALLLGEEAAHAIDAQPYVGIALNAECDLQAYVEVKSRTTTYEVRTAEYESSPMSVLLTIRRYWGTGRDPGLLDAYRGMLQVADELAGSKVVPIVVNPLAHAIAGRP